MKHNPQATTVAVTALLGLASLTACSSSPDAPEVSSSSSTTASPPSSPAPSSPATSPSPSASKAPKTAGITIKGFKYSNLPAVAPGTKITVTNDDSEAHTVTADEDGVGAFDVKIEPGKSAIFSAAGSAGAYTFHCTYHANMHGTLKVT